MSPETGRKIQSYVSIYVIFRIKNCILARKMLYFILIAERSAPLKAAMGSGIFFG